MSARRTPPSRRERGAPRIAFPDPDRAGADYRRAVAGRPPLNLYRMLPRAGALGPRFLEMGETIRNALTLAPRLREMAIVRVGVLTGAAYEVHHHRVLAGHCGVTPAQLDAVEAGETAELDEVERITLAYVDALVGDVRADDALFARAVAAIGADPVAELTLVVGFYLMVSRFLRNFDIAIETDLQHSTWL